VLIGAEKHNIAPDSPLLTTFHHSRTLSGQTPPRVNKKYDFFKKNSGEEIGGKNTGGKRKKGNTGREGGDPERAGRRIKTEKLKLLFLAPPMNRGR
jgi:hypothetical protein